MDFKGWKKIREDSKTCTLVHPKGHEMTIAMKALPPIHREQIKRLEFAGGGKINSDALASGEDGVSTQGKDVRHGMKSKERGDKVSHAQAQHFAREEAKGRAAFEKVASKPKLKGLAEGGEVDPKKLKGQEISDHKRKKEGFWESKHGKQSLEAANKHSTEIRRKMYADSEDVVSKEDSAPEEVVSPNTERAIQPATNITINAAPSSPAPLATSTINPAAEYAKKPTPVPVIPNMPAERPNLNPSGTMNPSANAENAQAANQAKAEIESSVAKAQLPLEAGAVDALGKIQEIQQQRYNDYEKHVNDAAAAINKGLINPKNYQENMGSGQKVATAIGLVLGGMGVPFGGQNFAMEFLNKQIDRDIEAQKSRSDQQKTILGAYQHLYGEGVAATAATKATLLDVMAHKTNQIALQLGTPQAAQKAMQLNSALAVERSKALQEGAVDLKNLPGTNSASKTPTKPVGVKAPVEGSGANQSTKPKGILQETILSPGAEAAYQKLQYTPKAKEQMAEITRQYTQAQQADKALKDVNGTYVKMWKEANEGGVGGRMRRTVSPHAVSGLLGGLGAIVGGIAIPGIGAIPGAGIGTTIGEGIGQSASALSNTETNRSYDSDKAALLGYVSAALKGTNIGAGQIQEIVDANAPEYGDGPKVIAKKLKIIRDFIKNHTETSLLKTWKLSHD